MDPVAQLNSSEWRETTLGDVVEFKNGINFTKAQKGESGTPTIDVRNMYGPGVTVDLRNLYRVAKQIGADHLLQPNDLLFVRSSLKLEGVGWTSMFAGSSEPVSFCGFIIRARPKNGLLIDPLFLTYFCRSDAARRQLIAGSGKVAITNISQDVLARLAIPLPPYEEQWKIAAVLGLVQRAIDQQERLIALTTELKKALLHKLFTEGLRGEPQKQTEIGPVPESWEVVPLSVLLRQGLQNGAFVRKSQFGKGVLFANVVNMYGDTYVNFDRVDRVTVSEREIALYGLGEGDLLVVRSSLKREGIGQNSVVGPLLEATIFDCHLIRVAVDSAKLLPDFCHFIGDHLRESSISFKDPRL